MGNKSTKKISRILTALGLLTLIALVPLLCSKGRGLIPARPATDSAASATALSTGEKTESGNIAWAAGDNPNGALTTMCERVKNMNKGACGLVSTVPFSHATPAPFAAHNISRGNYLEMSDEIIFDTRPEVVISGGHPHWSGGSEADPKYKFITENAYESLLT